MSRLLSWQRLPISWHNFCETLLSLGGWQNHLSLSLIAAGVYDADTLYTKLKTDNSIHRAEVKVINSVHRAEISKPEENILID